MNAASRLPALDWLRGLVMVLMAVDHCDVVWNRNHQSGDACWMPQPDVLPPGEFLTRWCSHLCAPTFLFLAGAGVALSMARSRARGEPSGVTARHWLLRGAVLLLLEVTLVSTYWRLAMPEVLGMLQVLFALGGGTMLLVALSRLPGWLLVTAAVVITASAELLHQPVEFFGSGPRSAPLWNGLLVSGGIYPLSGDGAFLILYPLLPWLPAMLLGHVFGRTLSGAPAVGRHWLAFTAGICLVLFVALRGWNGYGNMELLRRDGWLEWLHCSKYPPSATFLAMELGLMAALLLLLQRRAERGPAPSRNHPLLVLGQVPLFFYLLHLPVIGAIDRLGVFGMLNGWGVSWLMALLVSALLYWPCRLYRDHRQRRGGWTRYL